MMSMEFANNHQMLIVVLTFMLLLVLMLASVKWAGVSAQWAPILFFNPVIGGFGFLVVLAPGVILALVAGLVGMIALCKWVSSTNDHTDQ